MLNLPAESELAQSEPCAVPRCSGMDVASAAEVASVLAGFRDSEAGEGAKPNPGRWGQRAWGAVVFVATVALIASILASIVRSPVSDAERRDEDPRWVHRRWGPFQP